MALKPWFDIVKPREDLAAGKPLDASEFAVHLDQVRDGRAKPVYQNPAEFFERTYLTVNLTSLAAEVVRRLSGDAVATSPVFDFSTQFGGGKTHSLTLLYHLTTNGSAANKWQGVDRILKAAGADNVPSAAVAVFVGTEFDSIEGRGGKKGEPKRYTPWGEIAFQLGGKEAFGVVARHDEERTAPSAEVIRAFLPKDKPVVILMDELLNYMGRNRKSGLTAQLYNFVQNLCEEIRAQERAVLAVSIPSLLDEMTPEDEADFDRFKKMLNRLGKSVLPSAEKETTEIIRRRLFEWQGLPREANATIQAYTEWLSENKNQLPSWFPFERAREELSASYPFHPSVLSVFERKWQGLPRFQQTRGILRLLALWVSRAYEEGYRKLYKDPLISLGTAPLEDPLFRTAVFEQLGEPKLEGAVATDIAGKEHAHALRLDAESTAEVKKARLHRKVATTIFFESNGGQQRGEATLPEVRLSVAEPDLDIGNVEQCLEALSESCYYLTAEKNRFRFGFRPNLNKLLADRKASVAPKEVDDRVRAEVQKVFASKDKVLDCVFFPEESGHVPDRTSLVLGVIAPDHEDTDPRTKDLVKRLTTEHGSSNRTYKSGVIWAVADNAVTMVDAARRLIAWDGIHEEAGQLKLDDGQKQHMEENRRRAERDLGESVWRSYKNLYLLDKDNSMQRVDLGRITSSQAACITRLILARLVQDDLVADKAVSPLFLSRHWPPALPEWSTRQVRDAFFASPLFPRLTDPELIKVTIAKGVSEGQLGYVGKPTADKYSPFVFATSCDPTTVEITDEMFIIRKEDAVIYEDRRTTVPPIVPITGGGEIPPAPKPKPTAGTASVPPEPIDERVPAFRWSGEIPPQKWAQFYTKVLARFANTGVMKLSVKVEVAPEGGVTKQAVQDARVALRELGLGENEG